MTQQQPQQQQSDALPAAASHHGDPENLGAHAHPACPTCGDNAGEYVSLANYHKMMRLVRLQTTIPITVLVSMGTLLICGVVIHPGMREINNMRPTLLTPNNTMLVIYWAVFYALAVGFCILLIFARSDHTKDLFIHGVGLRFAVSMSLVAAWAVCWTLRMFATSEAFAIVNMIIVVSIQVTLLAHPPSIMHPLNSLFVHGSIALLTAILFELTVWHNGFVALHYIVKEESQLHKWTWLAVVSVAVPNAIAVFWEIGTNGYLLAIASEYILFTLLFASVRITPSLPDSAMSKPVPLLVTIIIFLCLHPMALVGGNALYLRSRRRGRIHLPSDDEEAVARAEHEREIDAEVEARVRAREAERAAAQSPPTGNLLE